MKLDADNKSGMWICNVLMIRSDVTDEEKTRVTGIQRQILANPLGYAPSPDELFWLKRIWWRGRRNGKSRKVKVEIAETEVFSERNERPIRGLSLMCRDCGHSIEIFGTGSASAKRGAIMLREQCPYGEKNFYDVSEWSEAEGKDESQWC